MAATLEYIGLNSLAPPSTIGGGTTTLTFAAATSDCRARWLFIDGLVSAGNAFTPISPNLLGSIFVDSIRINGGPNLVTGLIPLGCFTSQGMATNGFPSGELNLSLSTGDVVTVGITDSNPNAQVSSSYSAELKVDSASTTALANTAVQVVGKSQYWLGHPSGSIVVGAGASATWTSVAAPSQMYLDYWYNFATDSGATTDQSSTILLSSLTVSGAPAANFVNGFPTILPQSGLQGACALDVGQQVRILVEAGETVAMVFNNISATSAHLALGWSVLSND